MVLRGYLWERLSEEVWEEFAQPHPLVQIQDAVPYWEKNGWHWHIEGVLGDMSGTRKSAVRRRCETSTPVVKKLRAGRKEAGLCIDCGESRDPESKNYCPKHREADRKKAADKRRRRLEDLRSTEKKRLPDEREAVVHHFEILDSDGREHDGYVRVGLYEDGAVGEVFIIVGKPGDEHAVLDQWAIAFSKALQRGEPFEAFCRTFVGTCFKPYGATRTKEIPRCTSIIDYIARWLLWRFSKGE